MTCTRLLQAVSALYLLVAPLPSGAAQTLRAFSAPADRAGAFTARRADASLSNVVLTLITLAALPGQTLSGLTAGGDGNFYGVMQSGGSLNEGAVFQATPGGALNILYSFTGGADGGAPTAALTLGTDGALYGTASSGGNTSLDPAGAGTVFRIATTGGFTLLYSFTGGADGDTPFAALVQGANGSFYGTTEYGGDDGYGVVFSVTPGGAMTTLYSFDLTTTDTGFTLDNGASPASALVQGTNGGFYGTTQSGGANNLGTVFSVTSGGALTNLNSFTATDGGAGQGFPGPQLAPGSDGNFYGTTFAGGADASGTVFQLTPDGAINTLYSFTGGGDGGQPVGGLLVGSDGNFYGTTCYGGVYVSQDPAGRGFGTLFQLTPAGVITNLYSFTGGGDGGVPSSTLIQGADGGFYGTTATTVFELTLTTLPFIITPPAGAVVGPGANTTLTVSAGGSAPVGYQWEFNGTNLPGANSASLVLNNVGAAQAGYYAVDVTNAGGSTNSPPVLLAVTAPPVITVAPLSQTVLAGSTAEFSVAAAGSPPLTYQWRFNGTNIAGAGATNLTLSNVTLARVGNYNVVVGNPYGSVTSATAALEVNNVPPTISKQPAAQIAGPGQSAIFTVTASGTPPLGYQWELDGTNLPGATAATLTLPSVDPAEAGNYSVIISNGFGVTTSSNAPLTVALAPQFLAKPAGGTQVVAGLASVNFSATVAGATPLAYQWLSGGSAVPGATNSTYTITNAASVQSGSYSLEVTNPYGGLTSSPPTVLVVENAYVTTTLAGRAGSPATNNGTGGAARFTAPSGVAVDTNGNVYVADSGNDAIRKITANGVATTLAGRPGSPDSSSNGVGAAARFAAPTALALDPAGDIYVADTGNDTIRKVTPAGVVSTIAGQPMESGSNDGASNTAHFNFPSGLAVDSAGNIYVADTLNDTIRKIDLFGNVRTIAGLARSPGSGDGASNVARFSNPMGIAVDSAQNIYVADSGNDAIRKISPEGFVSTIAGRAGTVGTTDGLGTNARFRTPEGLALDSSGNLYVSDTENNLIRVVTPGGAVTTLSGGGGGPGPGGADGVGAAARFNFPEGIAVDSSGDLYVADTGNDTIRKAFSLGSTTPPRFMGEPQSQAANPGTVVSFAPLLSGSAPLSFQWQFDGRNVTAETAESLSLTNFQATQAGTYTLVVTNLAGSAVSSNAVLTLTTVLQLEFLQPEWRLDEFRFSFSSQSGHTYTLEYKDDLTAPAWTATLQSVSGTGGVLTLTDPAASSATRFYRVVIQ